MKVLHTTAQLSNRLSFKKRLDDSYFAQMARKMFIQKPDTFEKIESDYDDFESMMSSRDSVLKSFANVDEAEDETENKSVNAFIDFRNVLRNLKIRDSFSESIKLLDTYEKRDYHNLEHIENMIHNFNVYQDVTHQKTDDEQIFKMAVYMHDYYSGYPNDVKDSVLEAVNLLARTEDDNNIRKALKLKRLIIATSHTHDLSKSSHEEKLISDLDLAVLASEPQEYDEYRKKIRKEYSKYYEEDFIKGRIRVLERLLNREQIFYTPFFKKNYESKARANLERELDYLKNSSAK